MVINNENKFVFVHIPKTGGISITDAIQSNDGPGGWMYKHPKLNKSVRIVTHVYAKEIRTFMGESYNDFFTFGIVRNPWERLYSLYNFSCTKQQKRSSEFKIWSQKEYKEKGFKWFLLENELKAPRVKLIPVHTIVSQTTPQAEWLTDDNNNLIVDFVGRYETLKQDFITISQIINNKNTLKWLNKTTGEVNSSKYKKAYDNEMIDFVSTYHKRDIDLFEYTFE